MPDPVHGPDSRRDRLSALIAQEGADAFLVSRLENVRYLSGFTGSAGALLIGQAGTVLVTDSRYAEQAAVEAPGCRIHIAPGAPTLVAATITRPARLGFESEAVTHDLWERMAEAGRGGSGSVLIPCRGLVERLRIRKDPAEIAQIEEAVRVASAAFEGARRLIRPGAHERDVALEIEFRMKQEGAEDIAFDLIVASGPRSSLPHGRASGKSLRAGEFVVVDIGARVKGYHSDMTRTLYTGEPGPKQRALYETVLAAQQAGIAAVRPGVAAREVDRAARGVIEEAGHGKRFGHGTGHGVGLMIHEAPRVAPQSEETLEPGMVMTVEPGIYLPGEGGVRIEDIVVVTDDGARVMTPTPKDAWVVE